MEKPLHLENVAMRLESIVEGTPDALVILGGTIAYNEVTKSFQSGSFQSLDENSLLQGKPAQPVGGKDRVLAAVELAKVFPEADVVPLSQTRDPKKPTIAGVVSTELEKRGVEAERIFQSGESVNTVTEFKDTIKLWEEKGWKNIAFIMHTWQIGRAKALFNHIENFADGAEETIRLERFTAAVKEGLITIQFLDSAAILGTKDPHWKHYFEKLLEDEGMQSRMAAEEKAVRQIEGGTYGDRILTKRIWSY